MAKKNVKNRLKITKTGQICKTLGKCISVRGELQKDTQNANFKIFGAPSISSRGICLESMQKLCMHMHNQLQLYRE